MYGDKPNSFEVKDNPQFVSRVRNYCKKIPKSRLMSLRSHYRDINSNMLATFKDCVWLMMISRELDERDYENSKWRR